MCGGCLFLCVWWVCVFMCVFVVCVVCVCGDECVCVYLVCVVGVCDMCVRVCGVCVLW